MLFPGTLQETLAKASFPERNRRSGLPPARKDQARSPTDTFIDNDQRDTTNEHPGHFDSKLRDNEYIEKDSVDV